MERRSAEWPGLTCLGPVRRVFQWSKWTTRQRDDWPLEDPKGKPVEQVRRIREEVRSRVSEWLARQGWAR